MTDSDKNHAVPVSREVLTELQRDAQELVRLREAIALAYGYLFHVNVEPMAPIPLYSPEKAAYEARKVLRDLMTSEQRGEAICRVQVLLSTPKVTS